MKKKKLTNKITVFMPITDLMGWKGEFQNLPANSTYELIIDYPLSNWGRFKIKTGKNGLGLVGLLSKIGKLYQEVYDTDEEDEDGEEKYGVWGHDITDLHLEGIDIDHKRKKIRLVMGS